MCLIATHHQDATLANFLESCWMGRTQQFGSRLKIMVDKGGGAVVEQTSAARKYTRFSHVLVGGVRCCQCAM